MSDCPNPEPPRDLGFKPCAGTLGGQAVRGASCDEFKAGIPICFSVPSGQPRI